jgi:hypothetical protein
MMYCIVFYQVNHKKEGFTVIVCLIKHKLADVPCTYRVHFSINDMNHNDFFSSYLLVLNSIIFPRRPFVRRYVATPLPPVFASYFLCFELLWNIIE